MEIAISSGIGLVIGIFASFFAWWLVFHGIVPKITFASAISKLPTTDENVAHKYRLKFANNGSRALIEVQVTARLSVKGLSFPGNWSTINIPLEWSGEKKAEIPRIPRNTNRVLRLFINHSPDLKQSALFPDGIHKKVTLGNVSLEDLLRLGTRAHLTIYVSGFDEFSGARKLFQSQAYTVEDIREGGFKKLDVCPSEDSKGTDDDAQDNRDDGQQLPPGDASRAVQAEAHTRAL